jgi:hypothetical protein
MYALKCSRCSDLPCATVRSERRGWWEGEARGNTRLKQRVRETKQTVRVSGEAMRYSFTAVRSHRGGFHGADTCCENRRAHAHPAAARDRAQAHRRHSGARRTHWVHWLRYTLPIPIVLCSRVPVLCVACASAPLCRAAVPSVRGSVRPGTVSGPPQSQKPRGGRVRPSRRPCLPARRGHGTTIDRIKHARERRWRGGVACKAQLALNQRRGVEAS